MNRIKLVISSLLYVGLICLAPSLFGQCFNHYTLSPSGNYCGSSTAIYLSGSQSNVLYQLQVNGANYGTPVYGNGSSINLGTVTSSSVGGGGTVLVMASQNGSSCSPTVIAGESLYFVPIPSGTVTLSSTLVCPDGPVTMTADPAVSGSYNYNWYLNGTNVGSGPTYTTTTPGSYSVVISNSCGTATIPCPAISSWPSVGEPGAVAGPISRIAGTGTSTYTVGAANNAAAYNWQVSPATAGSFTGNGSTGTLTWNPDFYGTAIVSVTAAGDCGRPSKPSLLPVSVDLPGSSTYSYVEETDVRIPGITSASSIAGLPIGHKSVTYSYKDQAGRPIEQVMQAASPGSNDIVQPMAYDPAGRSVTTYLPYSVQGENNGSYKTTPLTNQAIYYNPNTPGAANIATSTNSTSQTCYDNSPLERVVEQGYPGTTWIQGGGHTTKTSYGTNSSGEVLYWVINANGNGAVSTYYNAGTLLTTTVTDENGNSATQYTDFNGKMVCKKVQSGPSTYLYTYYIYDDAGNLRYVIPPLPTVPVQVSLPNSFQESDAIFNNFFYAYHYDGRNRLTEKKIPGKGWEYDVYNRLDQIILSQTPTQQVLGVWMFTKYDAQGRVVMTGDYTTSASRATLQSAADAFPSSLLWETFNNSTSNYGYSDVSYPNSSFSSSKKVLTVNYYDNYSFLSNTSIDPNTSVFTTPTADTIFKYPLGLITGSLSCVLGASTPTYLLNINQYDTYGRVVKTIAQSFIQGFASSGNYDIIQNQYSFSNLLVKSTRFNYTSSVLQLTINSFYKYDNAGRKILYQQQYNSGAITNLAEYDYNELGQLYKKSLQAPGQPVGTAANVTLNSKTTVDGTTIGATNSIVLAQGFSTAPGVSFEASIVKPYMQTITYSYNIRGWLTKINDPNNFGTANLFAEEIDYDQPNPTYSNTTPQYNGNISTISWQALASPATSMVQELKGFVFNYDPLNRLTASYFKAPSGNDKYNESVTYDELGNILSLNRSSTSSTFLNKLTYDYGSGSQRGNILLDVQDNGGTENYSNTFGYQTTTGNEIANTKTGVTQIAYNEMNLPALITFSSGKTINFCYTSSGTELERVVKQGGSVSEDRSYNGGIEYVGSGISFISTDEGRARPASASYIPEYQIRDHLGNVRTVFGDEDKNNVFTANDDIIQTTDYYAFGREISYLEANPQFQYKFNGKEYSSDLNEYNYGARYYNPVTARWNAIDNYAEKGRRWSPYAYTNNNPVRYIDPDGNGYDYSDAIANAESSLLGTQISQGFNNGMQDMTALAAAQDYYQGKSNYLPSEYDPNQQAINVSFQRDLNNQLSWTQGKGPDEGGDLFEALNGGALSEGFNYSGFSSFVAHLTPFGGVVDFANAARNDNVGGAVVGIAETASFFTGDGVVESATTANTTTSSSEVLSPAEMAASWQGKGYYPGVDNWENKTLERGDLVAGLLPGQSNYYTPLSSLSITNFSQDALYQMLQIQINPNYGMRGEVGIYQLLRSQEVGISTVGANTDYGPGGLIQYFIPDTGGLSTLYTRPLNTP